MLSRHDSRLCTALQEGARTEGCPSCSLADMSHGGIRSGAGKAPADVGTGSDESEVVAGIGTPDRARTYDLRLRRTKHAVRRGSYCNSLKCRTSLAPA